MAWHVGTATNYRNLLTQLEQLCTDNVVATVAVNAGGTGYAVDDILTVAGGTNLYPTTLRVTTVSSGVITGLRIETHGSYSVNPTLTANAVTGGTGSGATVNLTYTDGGWTTRRNQTGNHQADEIEVILEGEGGGSDQIFVGIRSYNDTGDGTFNWELAGFTGYTAAFTWEDQPGKSPGDYQSDGGTYVPLNNAAISFWFSITGRRIVGVFKVGSAYPNMYLGFIDPAGTDDEFPYPLYVAGCTPFTDTTAGSTRFGYSGLTAPIGRATSLGAETAGGPFIRMPDGSWDQVACAREEAGSGDQAGANDFVIWPSGSTQNIYVDNVMDSWFSTSLFNAEMFIPRIGTNNTANIAPTPNSGGAIYPKIPSTLIRGDSLTLVGVIGELNNVFWTSGFSTVATEDIMIDGTDRFRVFQNCNKAEFWTFLAIKEE